VRERPEPNPYPRRKWVEYGALPAAILFWTAVYLFAPQLPQPRYRRRSPCASNLKLITYACQLFAGDNREAFPPDLGALYPAYISDGSIFICPKSRAPVEKCTLQYQGAITDENVSYCYVSGLTAADDPGYVLAFEEEWNHGGIGAHYACIGGQVAWWADIAGLHAQLAKQEAELSAKGRTMKIIRPSWSEWPARPAYLDARSRFWWIAGGAGGGVLILAAAATLLILRRRRRRGNGRPPPGIR